MTKVRFVKKGLPTNMVGMELFSGGSMSNPDDSTPGIPVIPTDSNGDPQQLLDLDSGAADALIGVRATPGAPDDTAAGERLAQLSSAAQVGPDNTMSFYLTEPVTHVHVVGVMNGTAAGGCINHTDTAQNAQTQMTKFNFSTAVDKVVVSALPSFATGQECQVSVEGYSYA